MLLIPVILIESLKINGYRIVEVTFQRRIKILNIY